MIVSQFTIGHNSYRGVATHHRILLTNRSATGYRFRLTLTSAEGSFTGKAIYSVERDSGFMQDSLQPAGGFRYHGRSTFYVKPQETVRLQIRPFDVAEYKLPQTSFEAFGFAALTIPQIVTSWGGTLEAQGDDPVPVLLHAYRVDWNQADGYGEQSAVAVASGQAENEIMPDGLRTLDLGGQLAAVEIGNREDEAFEDAAAFVDDPGSIALVLAFLGEVGQKPANLKVLNKLLHDGGHGLQVAKKKK